MKNKLTLIGAAFLVAVILFAALHVVSPSLVASPVAVTTNNYFRVSIVSRATHTETGFFFMRSRGSSLHFREAFLDYVYPDGKITYSFDRGTHHITVK